MRHIFITILILFSSALSAQVLLSGTVKDLTTDTPLIGAYVSIEGTNFTGVTDATGTYTIIFPITSKPKTYVIKVQYLGFQDKNEAIEILPIDDGENIIKHFFIQPDPLTIKDVTVTANKVEEELQDVPVAASVIDAQNMSKRSVSNTEEAVATVPNLVTDAFLPSRATFSIRGLASDFTNVGIENSVGLYIDDIYYSRSYNFNSTLIDIERIEVLRGPQGTLFGKNSIGGLIHVISENPKYATFGSVEMSAGNFRYLQFRGKYNMQLIPDKLAIRFSGAYRKRDGFLRQEDQGVSENNGILFYGGRLSLLYQPNKKVKFILKGYYNKDDKAEFTEDYKTPIEGVDLLQIDASERSQIDRLGNENETERQFNRETFGGLMRTETKLSRIHTLTTITGFNGFNSFHARDFDATSVDAVYTDKTSSLNNFSQEIRISTPRKNRKLFYVAGAYFLNETNENTDSLAFKEGMLPVWKVVLGNPSLNIPNYFESVVLDGKIKSTSYAGYASISYELADRIRVNGGARYTIENKEIEFYQNPQTELPLDESPVVSLVATPVGTEATPFVRTVTDRVFTGNIGMDFKTSDKTLIYVNFAKGFKGSGFNLTFTPDVDADKIVFQFQPEFMNSYEVGLKLKSRNRFLWNAAIFVTDFRNKQEVVAAGSSVFVSNAKSIQGQGFEGEFTGIWNKFFRTDISAGILNLRYLDFPFIDPNTLQTKQLSGNKALKAPNFTLKFSPEFRFSLGNDLRMMVRADYNVIGKSYNDIFNTESLARQTAGVLNGRISFSTTDQKFSISIWGKNVTDLTYFQHGWKYTWGEVISINPPRMIGLELRTNFY